MANRSQPQTVTLLGATGSIGDSTSAVIAANPDNFTVHAVTGHRNVAKLAERALQLGARQAVLATDQGLSELRERLAGSNVTVSSGRQAILECAATSVDIVVCAMVGAAGIEPAMAAIDAGNTIALANKEALVCAGPVMMERARQRGTTILPLDSEHNALFQVFEASNVGQIEALTLTASGGPFRTWSREQLRNATLENALKHPNWTMGQKVTIDSASLANKGLEVIEAYHLFGLEPSCIRVAVHPQSIVHGLVHYTDGSVLAQLGMPDMRTPIAAALAWPDRVAMADVPRLDLPTLGQLTFEPPDLSRFPMLKLAYEALEAGGSAPAFFNGANEVIVKAFLAKQCQFVDMPALVRETLDEAGRKGMLVALTTLDDVIAADQASQHLANAVLERHLLTV